MSNKKYGVLAFIAVGLCCFGVAYVLTTRGQVLPQGEVEFMVAPKKSQISLDGKKVKPGIKNVEIGPHVVDISHEGFATYQERIDVTQANKTFVGVALAPNSKQTKDWYTQNLDDAKISEGIASLSNDSSTELVIQKYPIFGILPGFFGDGRGGITKIDSESSINNSGKPSIGITASSPEQRRLALVWITNRGYDVSNVDVVFHGAQIPPGGSSK